MHSGLGTLSSGLPHSDITGSQPGCRLPCAFRRLQRPSSPLDAKTSVVRPCSITPTGRRNSLSLATSLTSRPAGFSSSRHMFGTNQLPQPSCDDWFPPTTQPFYALHILLLITMAYATATRCHLQLPPGDSLQARHIGKRASQNRQFRVVAHSRLRYQEETCRLYPVVKDQALLHPCGLTWLSLAFQPCGRNLGEKILGFDPSGSSQLTLQFSSLLYQSP